MLETVKNYIRSIPDEPFHVYYHRYILEFQDDMLNREAGYLSKKVSKLEDLTSAEVAISAMQKELIW